MSGPIDDVSGKDVPTLQVVPDYSKPDGLRAAWGCSDRRPISSMGHYRHNSTSPSAGKKTYVKTQPEGLQWRLFFFRANRPFISAPSGTLAPIARSSYQPIPVVPMHSLKGSHHPINLKNPFPSQVTPATPASYCEKTGPSQPASKPAQSSRVLAHSPTVWSFAFLPGGPGVCERASSPRGSVTGFPGGRDHRQRITRKVTCTRQVIGEAPSSYSLNTGDERSNLGLSVLNGLTSPSSSPSYR
ncbi:uncharacterized protein EI90DRAFT_966583 [Cantharellus anzutake]|uniref:uncharacterized protein n=1 Tax=Cantharellus anzutake TaxID=1750568 RepID=UPI00190666E9|nr:uncharacterized protein EI90DRAFT_966583 [Cantharellus anzutake]KAF8311522.1 hypothetical protein EI90DRAFT_966583 [Cantharellus anzutake]